MRNIHLEIGPFKPLSVLTYLIPRAVFVVPLYSLLGSLHLLVILVGFALAYLGFTLPFTTWLLIGFFQSILKGLDEAAWIDGCGRVGALIRVVLRSAAPGIVATGIYSFSTVWDVFMYPDCFSASSNRDNTQCGHSFVETRGRFCSETDHRRRNPWRDPDHDILRFHL
ncbi:MAG: ABC transporter permease subunit [Desulfatiglandales bacterium]